MHLNPFASFPSLDTEPELTEEEQLVQEKADRIKFHRDRVRNGPQRFSYLTNGQLRRAEKRAQRTQARKRRRGQVRTYLNRQREEAALRGQLQAIGVLPYAREGHRPSEQAVLNSYQALVLRFAPKGLDGEDLEDAEGYLTEVVKAATHRYAVLTGEVQA